MIGRLAGKLLRRAPESVLVDVHGVGYEVIVSLKTFCRLPEPGSDVALDIHTHVRENTLDLYGFLDPLEKRMFAELITVAGVGPRMAIGILSGMSPEDLRDAIAAGEVARLVGIPGVGRKTAQRLVTELRERVGALAPADVGTAGDRVDQAVQTQAVSALVNLGYREGPARAAVAAAVAGGAAELTEVIRQALRQVAVQA